MATKSKSLTQNTQIKDNSVNISYLLTKQKNHSIAKSKDYQLGQDTSLTTTPVGLKKYEEVLVEQVH